MRERQRARPSQFWLILAITLLAFVLRLWRLGDLPPGWRDDELINSLVISQKVLDGNLAVYYPDASGHEALYHALNAIMLGLFGANWLGIRLLSAFLGTLAVPLTFQVGRRLFGAWAGATAAAGLAFSFWGLMYARFGLRHVTMPVLVLAAFYFFWRGFGQGVWGEWPGQRPGRSGYRHAPRAHYLISAIFISLGFYTYFAGRGVPLILLGFIGYVWLLNRPAFRQHWRSWLVLFGVTAVLAIPLLLTLQAQPESEARVAELAVPLVAARQGDLGPLRHYVTTTLSMFHATGDDEWLYNIPHRPIFSAVGAVFFWIGVLWAAFDSLWPLLLRLRRGSFPAGSTERALPAAFLLLWWLAGIAPAFISVPPASLGHTILAQPAVYILAALPVGKLVAQNGSLSPNLRPVIGVVAVLLLLVSVVTHDLPDYFQQWPARGMVRFLYRADIQDTAAVVNAHPDLTDFGISGLLAGPWDRVALEMGLKDGSAVRPRWFNAERAILLSPPLSFVGFPETAASFALLYEPVDPPVRAGYYSLAQAEAQRLVGLTEEPVCFVNGLCWLTAVYNADGPHVELGWQVGEALNLPPMPLISNPPPPGVYAGPRLQVFVHLLDSDGNFLAGDDGLWVDPLTLQPGDIFLQQHWFALPQGVVADQVVFGLYDPFTGERIFTLDGRDHHAIKIGE